MRESGYELFWRGLVRVAVSGSWGRFPASGGPWRITTPPRGPAPQPALRAGPVSPVFSARPFLACFACAALPRHPLEVERPGGLGTLALLVGQVVGVEPHLALRATPSRRDWRREAWTSGRSSSRCSPSRCDRRWTPVPDARRDRVRALVAPRSAGEAATGQHSSGVPPCRLRSTAQRRSDHLGLAYCLGPWRTCASPRACGRESP